MQSAWVTSRSVPVHLAVREADRAAPTVVFVHGMRTNAHVYGGRFRGGNFLAALAEEGLNVVALDLQGHGLSEGRPGHVTYRDAMDNVAQAVSFALERFGAPVALAGSSMGGILAFYAALEDERVGAVASCCIADLRDVEPMVVRLRQRLVRPAVEAMRSAAERFAFLHLPAGLVFSPWDVFEDPDNVRRWLTTPRMPHAYSLASVVSIYLTPEDKPAAEAMGRPVLVLAGEEDRIFPVGMQEAIVRRLGSNADIFVLEGAGHMLPVEHTSVTAPKIGEWLRKIL